MTKTPEELYKEREKRINEAIQLKVPDRVPILMNFGFFAARYAGITCEEAFYNPEKWLMANKKAILDFEPDMYKSPQDIYGAAYEVLECKQLKWPGHGVPPDSFHQFVEAEYMKADEYDALLKDPTDFAIRTYLPRIFGTLKPFEMLPPLKQFLRGYTGTFISSSFAVPEVAAAWESLFKAGQEVTRCSDARRAFNQDMRELGFPAVGAAGTNCPFDMISDFLRGMRGTMLDMYRQPDKLLEAMERLLPFLVEDAVSRAKSGGDTILFMGPHRGADGFMSLKQFETFYWPGLKALLLALVDEGFVPYVFWEGDYTSRLEYLRELPKGKVICRFDKTDIYKAKEVLGDTMCITGNVPSSLLQTGTVQEVKDYCQKLIDIVGNKGGFIMDTGSDLDKPKIENVRAMVDFTKEYGVYA